MRRVSFRGVVGAYTGVAEAILRGFQAVLSHESECLSRVIIVTSTTAATVKVCGLRIAQECFNGVRYLGMD